MLRRLVYCGGWVCGESFFKRRKFPVDVISNRPGMVVDAVVGGLLWFWWLRLRFEDGAVPDS
jgi:hypothetical protein